MKNRFIRKLVPKPGQAFIHMLRFGLHIVSAIIIRVSSRKLAIENRIVIALIQNQNAIVFQCGVKLGQGLSAVAFFEHMRKRIAQANHGIEHPVHIAI